ncbi:FliI/YscN family ATPase [Tepidiforma flava]|uniref:FliI/YscN family ATPase n=1 Tax=Tepidiforma flava TaxID=3004094 RepID=A0ABY7M9E7_9CHLR|nr:FliI/YscN family ATPase [Tepidiforma flava]WBL36679.1 FliI/YscN family ATPase [Tepidiforma flava]
MTAALESVIRAVSGATLYRRTGTLLHSTGEMAAAAGINLQPGELVFIETPSGAPVAAEAAGSAPGIAHLALLERAVLPAGARVYAAGTPPLAPVGRALLGRILDGLGRPIDGGEPPAGVRWVAASAEPPHPLDREPIARPLPSGVRAVDGFLTLGRGQRVGIFAGSGVGKSTLLGMLARGTRADVTVIALIGERGREVRDFIEHDLGRDALRNCVVVASTGDNPAAMRICAARAATAIAEGFRDEGADVLLLFDSLTRVAMARREIGLAAGEPPTARGYPPSVFSMLPHLMERAGPGARGSITAVYTVLVDGEDMDEPIADLARATLDGHIVLRRALASAGHYPPIDVLQSVSRLMDRVASPAHREAARRLRQLLAAYEDARDLVAIGAYARGADPLVDRALELLPAINAFLRQRADECPSFDEALAALFAIDPEFAAGADVPANPAFRYIDPEEVTGEPVIETAETVDPAA